MLVRGRSRAPKTGRTLLTCSRIRHRPSRSFTPEWIAAWQRRRQASEYHAAATNETRSWIYGLLIAVVKADVISQGLQASCVTAGYDCYEYDATDANKRD